LKRGDICIVASAGEFGKPRPALIVQADSALMDVAITYVPITSDLELVPQLRVPVLPDGQNGLLKPSELMVDRINTATLSRFGGVIGRIDAATLQRVEAAMLVHLGLD
jgi:mRNA interferase MazF